MMDFNDWMKKLSEDGTHVTFLGAADEIDSIGAMVSPETAP